ncbi:urate hydroxylase PuuD [Pseudomarimonas arenosa]|uniref:Urate hydroxylase PuuD n=1 Tax=Pseudomarimonas arenosa TaxID=2774145 RepID=A0AAW3ZLS9_9GAMM|nr:urate hydroxylase PuuD [Pseudomarimonas arenosa]MBD8525622.1 urate hydroxylase PuuD [Pseudomarimonas arenosa]
MEGYLLDAATFLLRWLHVIAAIAWIGESFYFVALDRGLKPGKQAVQGLFGESWSVHGGGFYLKQKFMPAPAELPEELHWSKWKSYTTWLSGFALLAISYLWQPSIYLVDPRVYELAPDMAVAIVIALFLVGWVVYDLLCRAVGFRDGVLGVVVGLLVVGLCLLTTSLFAGRAAFLLTGAVLATWMSANVFFVIIPGQKRIVAALSRGEAPNPLDGLRGKQRSVHNTYFTLPVVFAMLSTHYAAAYAHPQNGWLLVLFLVSAALIRQFFVLWHSGGRAWGLLALGGAFLLGALAWMAPAATPSAAANGGESSSAIAVAESSPTVPGNIDSSTTASLDNVHTVLQTRCLGCHATQGSIMPIAPKGLILETPEQIERAAQLIHQQTVVLRVMPPGNMTQMTDEERLLLQRWYEGRQ